MFANWDDFLEVEKKNYLRWSDYKEIAARDLMKEEPDGSVRFHTSGVTARGAIKSMYYYPISDLADQIAAPILLLQATLPEGRKEVRTLQVNIFQKQTNAVVKAIEGTTHLLHWNDPYRVVEEVIDWFK